MAKKYQEKVFFTIEELKRIHTLINMTAEELYIRYGKKRGELIFERQTIFEDARSLDISYRVGNESNEKAQISVVLKNPDEFQTFLRTTMTLKLSALFRPLMKQFMTSRRIA